MRRWISSLGWVLLAGCVAPAAKTPAPAPAWDHQWSVSVVADRLAGPATMASPDELTPGTTGLSLREALLIAAHSTGSSRISFDATAFPPTAPVVLALETPLPALTGVKTAIDGTGAGVIVDGTLAASGFVSVEANQVSVSGLTLRGFVGPVVAVKAVDQVTVADLVFDATAGPALDAVGSTGLTVRGCTLTGVTGDGLVLTQVNGATIDGASMTDTVGFAVKVADSTQVSVTGARIHGAGSALISMSNSDDVAVTRSTLNLNSKVGTFSGIDLLGVRRAWIADNVLDPGTAWLLHLTDSPDGVVERNVFDGADTAIVMEGACDGTLLFQNVMMNMVYHAAYLAQPMPRVVVAHNTFYLMGDTAVVGVAPEADINNLLSTAATDFVDPTTYDFHLAAGNPAIDTGIDRGFSLLPGRAPRFLGPAPDLGAVETR